MKRHLSEHTNTHRAPNNLSSSFLYSSNVDQLKVFNLDLESMCLNYCCISIFINRSDSGQFVDGGRSQDTQTHTHVGLANEACQRSVSGKGDYGARAIASAKGHSRRRRRFL